MCGSPRARAFAFLTVATLAMIAGAGSASACTIDGKASMVFNGAPAGLNHASPNRGNLAWWAPFSLGEASPGSPQVLAEDPRKLQSVLPSVAFRHPFRWTFGDGGAGAGMAITHQFARTGWYRVQVAYYYPSTNRWVQFDSAQLHVVPAVTVQATSASAANGVLGGNQRLLVMGASGVAGLVCLVILGVTLRGLRPRAEPE